MEKYRDVSCCERNWYVNFNPAPSSFISNSDKQGKPKDDICSGMKTLVEVIGQAYERANADGGNKEVLAHMNHKENGRPKRSKIKLVHWLVAHDHEFNPGAWYTESKFPTSTNVDAFNRLLQKVEAHTDVRWLSWLPVAGGTDVAPVDE